MNAIEEIYSSYDFSSTRCYVISLPVNRNGYNRIEHKMPGFITNLKGIFISVSCKNSATKIAGFISLNFNGQALKNYYAPVLRTNLLKNCSYPEKFDEIILPNSLIQGFYFDSINDIFGFPYTLSIYIHYQPQNNL